MKTTDLQAALYRAELALRSLSIHAPVAELDRLEGEAERLWRELERRGAAAETALWMGGVR